MYEVCEVRLCLFLAEFRGKRSGYERSARTESRIGIVHDEYEKEVSFLHLLLLRGDTLKRFTIGDILLTQSSYRISTAAMNIINKATISHEK